HPATHGVLRIVIESDGEVVATCTPDHGYLHRSIEKIGECVEYPLFVPYTDRVDYVCAMNANLAYCVAVEQLLATDTATAVQVPVVSACAGRRGAVGYCYDRYVVRLLEVLESVRLCREVLKILPPAADKPADPTGGYQADVTKKIKRPPKGEVHCRTEAPRGE